MNRSERAPGAGPNVLPGPFDQGLIVLRQVEGRQFDLRHTLELGRALRHALMARARPAIAPDWLSGHQTDGAPLKRDHVAIVPLAFVGREHADGHLLGLGLALPRAAPWRVRDQLVGWLRERVRLYLGETGDCTLERDERDEADRSPTLRPGTYGQAAETWVTVTPLVFDHFPRRGLKREQVVADACERAGYPLPVEVYLDQESALFGAPGCREVVSPNARGDRPPRPMTHALVRFALPVNGPVLLGASRYAGYGLCRPWRRGEGAASDGRE